ncbi:MAG: hypothetical protein KGL39_44005 [Patescibacteria group bacterium]|nr:hypothetical protein [Patescibacteria group bacterium]
MTDATGGFTLEPPAKPIGDTGGFSLTAPVSRETSPFRPTGPIPGDPNYVAPKPMVKPHGMLEYALTQGGTIDPSTAKGQLVRDALTALESTAGMGPAGGIPGEVAEKGVTVAAKGAGKGAKAAARGLTDVVGGLGTHTGGESIRQAFHAGYEGGQKAQTFLDAMRGNAPMSDVVDTAKNAVDQLGVARNAAYKTGMGAVAKDPSLLNFDAIDRAVDKAMDIGTYKGQVINEEANKVATEIKDSIAKWKELDPREFHTAEGLDALKKQLNAIWESTAPHTAARKVVTEVQRAIKDSITEQAPVYAKVMKDYHDASDAIRELEKGLSLGEKTTVDTALRKLQSVMRNNVNTNFGNRLKMVMDLDEKAGGKLMPALAGHALSSATPRGLGALQAGATGGVGLMGHPAALAALPLQSPRLVGEGAYYLGSVPRWIGEGGDWLSRVVKSIYGG